MESTEHPAQPDLRNGLPPIRKWLLLTGGMGLFLVVLKVAGQLQLSQETLVFIPLSLAAGAAFLLWPGLTLAAWIFLSGVITWPLLGEEIYLYDLMTALLLLLLVIRFAARGTLNVSGLDGWVLAIYGVAIFSVLVNLHRLDEVSDLFIRLRQKALEFPGKLQISALLLWLTHIVAYFAVSQLADTRKKILWCFLAVLGMGVANCIYALYGWSQNPAGFSRWNTTLGFLFMVQDQGHLSALVLLGMLSTVLSRWGRGFAWRWWLFGLTGSVFLMNLVFNFTRAVYVEFVLGILILLFLSKSGRLFIVIFLIGALIAGVLMSVKIERQATKYITAFTSPQGRGLTLRMAIWKDAVRLIREDGKLMGVGLGNYLVYNQARFYPEPGVTRKSASAHSLYLQVLAEQGVPGLLVWLGFLIATLRFFYRRLRRATDPISRSLYLWLFTILIIHSLDSLVYMSIMPPPGAHTAPSVGYYLWILLGLGVAYSRLEDKDQSDGAPLKSSHTIDPGQPFTASQTEGQP